MKKNAISGRRFQKPSVLLSEVETFNKIILKKLIKINPFIIGLVAIVLYTAGCQKEYLVVSEPSTETTITANDTLADLIQKVSLKDGSFDNLIDNCNEISIKFPYTIDIKGETIEISSTADVGTVKLQYPQPGNSIKISYPVTVVFSDYSETTLSNNGDLKKIQNQYNSTIDDDDIECVDFIYPVEIMLYNTKFQKFELIEAKNDKELFKLFNKISNKIAEIKYPILAESQDGNVTNITNNTELENILIEGANAGCNEEDEISNSEENIPPGWIVNDKLDNRRQ